MATRFHWIRSQVVTVDSDSWHPDPASGQILIAQQAVEALGTIVRACYLDVVVNANVPLPYPAGIAPMWWTGVTFDVTGGIMNGFGDAIPAPSFGETQNVVLSGTLLPEIVQVTADGGWECVTWTTRRDLECHSGRGSSDPTQFPVMSTSLFINDGFGVMGHGAGVQFQMRGYARTLFEVPL